MNNVLQTVLSVSVSGAVLSLLLLIVKPLLKNRVSKAFSYYIWILVLLRLVIPFGYNVNIPGIPQLLADTNVQDDTIPAADAQGSSDNAPDAAGQTGQPAVGNVNNATPENPAAGSENEDLQNTTNTPAAGDRSDLWELMRSHLISIWLAGAIVSLGWYTIAYTVFSRKVSRSFADPHSGDLAFFNRMTRGGKVRLTCSSQINTPMLIGAFRPVIVLPQLAYTVNGMGGELYGILSHELTHYYRHDIVYKWLVVVVTSFHWFNPLVYLIRREISNACELACDEAVIQNMSISERKRYGNTLLALASKHRVPEGVMATTLCEGKKQLKGRLINIMNYKKKTHAAIALMMVLALLLTGCATSLAAFDGGETESDQGGSSATLQPSATPQEASVNSSPTDDNENQETTQPSGNAAVMEIYKAVLQGDTEFFSTDVSKNLNINELNQAVNSDSSVTAKATKFAIVDLDNDSTPEVILWLTVNNDGYYGFEVLRYQDGTVYGYTLWYRSFMDLKANGTFTFSSGAADAGFGTVTFAKDTYSIDRITYSESSYDSNNNMSVSYFVNHESATKDEFLSAVNRQSEEADATWYDFTDENIKTALSET